MSKHLPNRRSGFTLVELMVVAIIVAILASVAVPLMSGNKKRALGTEADTMLGSMRTQLRIMYVETGNYLRKPNGSALGVGSVTNIPGVIASDIHGRYWNADSYTIDAITANSFTLKATGVSTGDTAGLVITMTDAGIINRTGF